MSKRKQTNGAFGDKKNAKTSGIITNEMIKKMKEVDKKYGLDGFTGYILQSIKDVKLLRKEVAKKPRIQF